MDYWTPAIISKKWTAKYILAFPSYKKWTNLNEINEYAKRFLLEIDFENFFSKIQFGKFEQFESFVDNSWDIYTLNGENKIIKIIKK
jgi:myosin-crossreactive antigen